MTAHVARELEAILAQLKKQDRMSLYELLIWIEFCLPALVMIIATHQNIPELILVGQAVKKAFEVKKRLLDLYGDAKERLIAEYKLTYVKSAISHPEVTSDEQAQKLLKASDQRGWYGALNRHQTKTDLWPSRAEDSFQTRPVRDGLLELTYFARRGVGRGFRRGAGRGLLSRQD